ncbi:MAG: ABC transporter ATP-binding protein [Bacteroidales bacterium]|nr:ABC transporter ATP-binding protein [Clostridium sp.]MCM1203920.1 ABC transporter ATP-binding protein [Bacteroidales bacterium]
MRLSMEGLTKRYGNKAAVNCVSAEFGTGVYGLLGANGAGKTTLMRMLCGILTPTFGEVKLDGMNNLEMGEAFREQLGYLPQDFGYYPDFKAREFMLYVAALKGLLPIYAKERSDELLDMVGLKDVADKKIKTFSGGMKQRLGIAQAMLNNPKILILDEPTAGLDPKERVRFRNLIADFASERMVLLSTHIVSDVEYIADEILMMKNGELTAQGTVTELVDTISDKVWQVTVDRESADVLCSQYNIINLRHVEDKVELRIVSDEAPADMAENVMPALEDLYLYEFKEM